MKVIFSHPYPVARNEGLDRAILGLAKGLRQKGVTVEFVILESTDKTLKEYQRLGKVWSAQVRPSPPTPRQVGRRIIQDILFGSTSRRLYKTFETLRDDDTVLVAAQEFCFSALLRASKEHLFRASGWWCFGTPHLYASMAPMRAALDRPGRISLDLLSLISPVLSRKFWELGQLDFILAGSRWLSDLLAYFGGFHPLGVLYPPTDTDVYSPLKKNSSSHTNGRYVFSLGDTKDVRVDVLDRLSQHVPVVRAGRPRLSKAFNLPDAVDGDLIDLYASAVATAYPTHIEQFGLPVAESLACGTPVLTFPWQGPGELITDGATGWKAKTVDDFLQIAGDIMEGGYDLSMREKCREFAVSNLSLEASAGRFLDLFR